MRHSLIVAVNGLLPGEGGEGRGSREQAGEGCGLQIDINVIQPTPNISPCHSLRSLAGDCARHTEAGQAAQQENFAGIPFLIVPPSPVRVRRVSFSDNSLDTDPDYLDCDSVSLAAGLQVGPKYHS